MGRALSGVTLVIPEIISLVANIADIFLDSTLKLYIVESACHSLYTEQQCQRIRHDDARNTKVQELAAFYMVWNNVILALPVLVVLPVCGSWSDATRKRKPIMLCAASCAVAAAIFWFNALTPGKNLYIILVGTVFRAVACRISVITLVVSTLIAENTSTENRTRRMSYLLSMRYIGIIFGLLTQGVLLRDNRFPEIFTLDTALFVSIIFISLFLKDSDHRLNEPHSHWHLWDSVQVLWRKPASGTRAQLWIIFAVTMIDRAAKNADYEVSVLYMGKKMPDFSNADFSWFRSVETVCCAVIATVGVRVLFVGGRERELPIAIAAVGLRIVKMIVFAFTDDVVIFYIANMIGTPITLMVSTCRSLLSQVVSEDGVAKAFSMASCLEMLANMLGSAVTLRVYTATSAIYPGAVYLFIALQYSAIFVLLVVLHKTLR